jgi:inosine/xanthosine triphosphatase
MRIVVGSKNPIKIGAVEEAFKKYWPDCEVVGIETESGVSAQPMSEKETMNGARQRAYNVINLDSGASFGVGLEGGVTSLNPTSPNWVGTRGGKGRLFECAWVCIVNREKEEGLGGGLYFELPEKVAVRVKAGEELGPVMSEISKEENVKQRMGAIGIFTKGELDRRGAYVQIVLSAMIKFVSPEWFQD